MPREPTPYRATAGPSTPPRKKRRLWRVLGLVLLVLVVIGGVGRAFLPWLIRDHVNRILERNVLYSGQIGEVRVHLWRGAYSIEDIRVNKKTGSIPVPFFVARRVDFALEWGALRHGRVVGRMRMDQPELNFVGATADEESQTGVGGPWLQMIRDLFPFKIDRAVVRDGAVHFRAFQTDPPLDVYLSRVQATIDNLTNVRDETTALPATVQASGLAMEQARFEFKMTLDPFSYHPTFHLATRLLGLDVTKINDLALAYGNVDFKRGWFDFVVEMDVREGQIDGYAKPLFRDLKVFDLGEDIKNPNPLRFMTQAIVGAAAGILKNRPRNQFGTLISFTGEVSGQTRTDLMGTVGNILRNAFVRAYLPRLEDGGRVVEGVQFSAPEFTETLANGDFH